jgi:hypothetical protein
VLSIVKRISGGRGRLPWELALRFGGVGVIAGAWLVARSLCRWSAMPRPHPATFLEFAMTAAAFALLTTGLAFLVEGPGLFRQVPIPRHSAFFPASPAH